jgi:hypothetical protein
MQAFRLARRRPRPTGQKSHNQHGAGTDWCRVGAAVRASPMPPTKCHGRSRPCVVLVLHWASIFGIYANAIAEVGASCLHDPHRGEGRGLMGVGCVRRSTRSSDDPSEQRSQSRMTISQRMRYALCQRPRLVGRSVKRLHPQTSRWAPLIGHVGGHRARWTWRVLHPRSSCVTTCSKDCWVRAAVLAP